VQLVRQQNQLPTVKISLSLGGSGRDRYAVGVEFEVGVGPAVLHSFTVEPTALGIPPGFEPGSFRFTEPDFALSPEVAIQLTQPGLQALGEEQVLWLQLASPTGFLAALPWEWLLRPLFGGIPVLRVPDFAFSPKRGDSPIDIVLCLSEPSAKPEFDAGSLLEFFLSPHSLTAERAATIHIFSDLPTYHELAQSLSVPNVVLHDPLTAPERSDSPPPVPWAGGGEQVTDPWLRWILDEMQGTTVEVVHFVTHGYVTGDQPAIAVAESPTRNDDRLWARFIGSSQLAACLTQLGAWSVGFSSPPSNFSRLGLRQLADSIARLWPGPVLYHDAAAGDRGAELDGSYASLFDGLTPSFTPASFLYVHPRAVGLGSQGRQTYAESLVAQTLGPTPPSAMQPWAVTTQRFLEQSAARLFPEQERPNSEDQEAVGEGVRRALEYVSNVLREHRGRQA
jgi:hypothetical protein